MSRNVPRTDVVMRALACLGVAALLTACGPEAPKVTGAPPDMRRLTDEQYRNSIADVFGASIKIGGKLDPLIRTGGLIALGARSAPITPSGLEMIDQLGRSIAGQVVDAAHRDILVGCGPADSKTFDDACATQFFARTGRMLYRRPLSDTELKARVSAARAATENLGDFYAGLSASLSGMLVSPNFLFVIDSTEPDPANAGALRLDAFAKASRLSFFLWDTTPDDELLAAAEAGALNKSDGLKKQIDRMLSSARLDGGVRGFFADALALDKFDTLEKDSVIYPAFNLSVSEDAREQTLRTISDVLVARGEDYRNLFTTRHTYMSAALARIYRVHVPKTGQWVSYEYPADDPRVGIQSQISFTALHSHPGRSSPTLRGKAVRELLLCQKIPDPPADVDFTKFNDPNSPMKTARDRLSAHTEQPACAGCHKLTDPLGLGMEKFDGAGQLRIVEQDVPIDPTGDLDGKKFTDTAGLGKELHDNAAAAACVVNQLYAYGIGRVPSKPEQPMIAYLQERFAADGYKYTALLKNIVQSDAFFAVSPRTPTTASAQREMTP